MFSYWDTPKGGKCMSLFTLQQKIEKIILLQSMEILCDIEIGKAAFQSLPLQLRANQSLGKVGRVLYAERNRRRTANR